MKRNTFVKILSIVLSIILVISVAPISVVAEETETPLVERLQNQLKIKVLTYTDKTKYQSTVKMGNVTVQPYHYKNLIYSSPNLSTSTAAILSTINTKIYVPKVIIGVYDGNNLPTFPVTAFTRLTTEDRIAGMVLADEEGLYEFSSPTNSKGCTNVWRGINGNTTWTQPEDQETIFFLGSKRSDWHYKVYYTRGNYNGYDITMSNMLTPRASYLNDMLASTDDGYIKSDYNDTGFNYVAAAYSDGSLYEHKVTCTLGDSAVQYFIDTSELNNVITTAKNEFSKVYKYNTQYDTQALIAYYQSIINMLDYCVSDKFTTVNDNNAEELVQETANDIKTLIQDYYDARDNLGELYIDLATVKEYVNANYSTASITKPNEAIVFSGVTVNDVSKWGTNYNFGKNLAYCSKNVIQGPNIIANNVSSCTVVPTAVVMIYDGVSETSFPIKWAYGVSKSNSGYSGSKVHSIFLANEVSENWGASSSMYTLGNYYWLNANHTSPAVDIDKWFTSADQINSRCENFNYNNGTEGINLSLQYSGFYNKVVLNNANYSNSLEVEPLDHPINLNVRYYYPENDPYPHRVSNNTKQYVLNIVPLMDKISRIKTDYEDKIIYGSIQGYTQESLNRYYRAIYNIINFSIEDEFSGCTDTNAKAKTVACSEKINNLCAEYDEAYKGLVKAYTISFQNYNGDIVKTEFVPENEMPTPPENTPIAKVSEVSKFHFTFSWPTINKATADITYRERRSSVLCTLDDGTVTKKPTCQEDGVREYLCSVCNGVMVESITKLKHDYSVYAPQYEIGTPFAESGLKHDIKCSVGGEKVNEEECSFKLIANGDATIIYECISCGGLVTYTKSKCNITFIDENDNIIESKTYYEDQTIYVPDLKVDYIDKAGHHSFKWDIEPSTIPASDMTYRIVETIVKHQYTSYTYNNDANKNDIHGTETARCDIANCTFTDTRASSDEHAPTKFDINGKIMISDDTKGTASTSPAKDITVAIDGTEAKAVTNENGDFTLEQLGYGEYTLVISGESTIDRTINISVTEDNVDYDHLDIEPIGIVIYDYNKDGIINTIDATIFSKKNTTITDVKIFKAIFNRTIKYDTITMV